MCTMASAADVIVQMIYGIAFKDANPLMVDAYIYTAMQVADVSSTAGQLAKALFT